MVWPVKRKYVTKRLGYTTSTNRKVEKNLPVCFDISSRPSSTVLLVQGGTTQSVTGLRTDSHVTEDDMWQTAM